MDRAIRLIEQAEDLANTLADHGYVGFRVLDVCGWETAAPDARSPELHRIVRTYEAEPDSPRARDRWKHFQRMTGRTPSRLHWTGDRWIAEFVRHAALPCLMDDSGNIIVHGNGMYNFRAQVEPQAPEAPQDPSPAPLAESPVMARTRAGRGGIRDAAPSTTASGDTRYPADVATRYPGSPVVNDAGTRGDFGADQVSLNT